jgi:hypothetical protein
VSALVVRDNNTVKRLRYPSDVYLLADNASANLPYNVGLVRVRSNSAAVNLRIKDADYRDGKRFMLEVAAYTNAIKIRNEADTFDLVGPSTINATGIWLVYVSEGQTVRASKLGELGTNN